MSRVSIKITGAADFRKNAMAALRSIEANTESGLDRVADATKTDARANCPVSADTEAHKKGDKTHMRDTIDVEKERLKRTIGTDKFYAPFVEHGTYKMDAQPFMFPAWEHNRQGLLRDLKAMKV